MSILLMLAMQVAPPVIDPVLMPRRDRQAEQSHVEVSETPSADVASAQRLLNCLTLSQTDAQAAIAEGARWLLDNGGIDAELCVGAGYEAAEQWEEAEQAYLRAAGQAQANGDARHAAIVGSTGRMALIRGEAETAKTRFDVALADMELQDEFRGNFLMERARAHVALEDGSAAQADLITTQALLPNDPSVWLLSATLARRQGDFETAGDFIDRALELDQSNPASLLEAGNIAIGLNAYSVARQAWGQVVAVAPASAEGQAAQRNIDRLDALVSGAQGVPVELPETEAAAETGEPEL